MPTERNNHAKLRNQTKRESQESQRESQESGRPAGRPAYIIKAGRPASVFHILEIYYKEGSIRVNAYALETRLIASSTLIQTTLLWWGTSQFVTYFEIWPPEGSKRNAQSTNMSARIPESSPTLHSSPTPRYGHKRDFDLSISLIKTTVFGAMLKGE